VARHHRYATNNLLLLTDGASTSHAPTAAKVNTTPLRDGQPKYMDDATINQSIEAFIDNLTPKIAEFLQDPQRLSVWVPEADKITQDFYRGLQIPKVNGQPSLLLHDLGKYPNKYANDLFRIQKHR
jgi:hypothetical protein